MTAPALPVCPVPALARPVDTVVCGHCQSDTTLGVDPQLPGYTLVCGSCAVWLTR